MLCAVWFYFSREFSSLKSADMFRSAFPYFRFQNVFFQTRDLIICDWYLSILDVDKEFGHKQSVKIWLCPEQISGFWCTPGNNSLIWTAPELSFSANFFIGCPHSIKMPSWYPEPSHRCPPLATTSIKCVFISAESPSYILYVMYIHFSGNIYSQSNMFSDGWYQTKVLISTHCQSAETDICERRKHYNFTCSDIMLRILDLTFRSFPPVFVIHCPGFVIHCSGFVIIVQDS